MAPQGVLFRRLWCSLGVIDVEDNVTLTNIKIPGDHRGSFHNLNENLGRRKQLFEKPSQKISLPWCNLIHVTQNVCGFNEVYSQESG